MAAASNNRTRLHKILGIYASENDLQQPKDVCKSGKESKTAMRIEALEQPTPSLALAVKLFHRKVPPRPKHLATIPSGLHLCAQKAMTLQAAMCAIVAAWTSSGLTKKTYIAHKPIGLPQFNYWCDKHGQQMAGQRYVGSTEAYQVKQMEDLCGYFAHTVPPVSEHIVPLFRCNFSVYLSF